MVDHKNLQFSNRLNFALYHFSALAASFLRFCEREKHRQRKKEIINYFPCLPLTALYSLVLLLMPYQVPCLDSHILRRSFYIYKEIFTLILYFCYYVIKLKSVKITGKWEIETVSFKRLLNFLNGFRIPRGRITFE